MLWLLIVIIGRFIDAWVAIIDKLILKHTIFKPASYAFFTGIFSIFTVGFIIPISWVIKSFGVFDVPDLPLMFFDFFIGIILFFAIFSLFSAFYRAEASRVATFIGSLTPIFTLGLSFFILGEKLPKNYIWAFVFLILGNFVIAFGGRSFRIGGALFYALLSAFLWALFFILIKKVFGMQSFTTTLFWMELGLVIGALLFLLKPAARKEIFKSGVAIPAQKSHIALFVFNKLLARVSSFLIMFAVSLGNVTMVNALESVKYVFIFLIAILFSAIFPKILKEELSFSIILQKALAIILIGAGIFALIY
ncbi:MAG: DMT family transporter [Patescibacteria group bacterium]